MKVSPIQLHKLQRAVQWQGVQYTFVSYGRDANNEPNDVATTKALKGIFHETAGHVYISSSEDGSIKSGKPSPFILTLLSSTAKLRTDDVTTISGKTYKVTDIRDIGNLGIVADVSLEVVV